VVLYSESDLWHHLGDIHSTHKPDTGKKRQRQLEECEDEHIQISGASKKKRPRIQGILEAKESKEAGGRKSAHIRTCLKDFLGHRFVNILADNFVPCPPDTVGTAVVSGGSLSHHNTPDSICHRHGYRCSNNALLLTQSEEIPEAVPRSGHDCYSLLTNLSEATTVGRFDIKLGSIDVNMNIISSSISSLEDEWILSSPNTPLSDTSLSSVLIELIDPELRINDLSSVPNILPTINPVEATTYRSRSITAPGIESSAIRRLCESRGVGGQPVAIDVERGIWNAEALLAKWKCGRTTWYLVKWDGFLDRENTWEKSKDISHELIKEFEATYQGNNLGVRLLKKRVRRGIVEYLVKWKGRPESEKSWEKEATICRERIIEFEAR